METHTLQTSSAVGDFGGDTAPPASHPPSVPGSDVGPVLLVVDDEANVINALRRTLRSEQYQVVACTSGAEAIEFAKNKAPDVVLCDMRMPGLNGVEVLKAIRLVAPHCARILLTGYADMQSTVDAINQGQIHKYLSKPWNDLELKAILHEQTALAQLRAERDHLSKELAHNVQELQDLNAQLDKRVEARTQEIHQTALFLEQAHRELRVQFLNAVHVFSNLLEQRVPEMAGHSRRVDELACILARELQCTDNELNDIHMAALLHDIGKIGLPDRVFTTSVAELDGSARVALNKHPIKGQTALLALEGLHTAGLYIRHHHERFDGQGYPDGLVGSRIPRGARILAVAEDFDELQRGWLAAQALDEKEALSYIQGSAGKRYDPDVVAVLPKALEKLRSAPREDELLIDIEQLVPGMKVSRDLLNHEGVLLLVHNALVSSALVQHLRQAKQRDGLDVKIYVYKSKT